MFPFFNLLLECFFFWFESVPYLFLNSFSAITFSAITVSLLLLLLLLLLLIIIIIISEFNLKAQRQIRDIME